MMLRTPFFVYVLVIFFFLDHLGHLTRANDDIDAFTYNQKIGRGINLGHHLGNSQEKWAQLKDFKAIKKVGFQSIRISVAFSDHAKLSAPYTIDPKWLKRVDTAIQHTLDQGLIPILDFHGYGKFEDGTGLENGTYDPRHGKRFVALWKQIANHYKDWSSDLSFEILNEPHDNLDKKNRWNTLLNETITAIRDTGGKNQTRILIIGGFGYSGYRNIKFLELPQEDRYLIATFHYYKPMPLTHQGAKWLKEAKSWKPRTFGTPDDIRVIDEDFAKVKKWATTHNRPIFLGEYGCTDNADRNSRVTYTKSVAKAAEKNDFSHAYWGMIHSFGIYDPQKTQWDQGLLEVILPPSQ